MLKVWSSTGTLNEALVVMPTGTDEGEDSVMVVEFPPELVTEPLVEWRVDV